MEKIRVIFVWGIVLFLALGAAMTVWADAVELKDIPLQWKPKADIRSFRAVDLTVFQKADFFVKPFTDLRKNKAEIGVNIERRDFPGDMPVTTKDNVAQWVGYHFGKTLSDFDIKVGNEKGTLTLEADILKFYVVEKTSYKAEVSLKVRLLSKNNTVLWEDMISGTATRFGKSYFDINYFESLSDAMLYTVHTLLQNDSFKQAVRKASAGTST
ncbi:MAG: hypothetical protein AB1585_03650 [Thermodesulfobacteriota bacterium]